MPMSKVYLVDGSGYIFRAYYAIAPLSTKDGFPTNALYGYFRMLAKLLSQAETDHMVMVFDTGEETFRHKLYDEYKANRDECPTDLVQQMPYFRDIARAFGLKVLEQVGYEADDIIGTLATRLSNAKIETVIISGDKDLMQLITDKVKIFDAMKDAWIGRDEVIKKFGVGPEKVVEILSLMGDSSDNIPGLHGAGPKTALQLIEQFGTVENVLNSAQVIRETKGIRNREKIAQTIESNSEIVRLSRKLVEIDCEMPLTFELNGSGQTLSQIPDSELYNVLVRKVPDERALSDLAAKFEFTSLLKVKDFKLKDFKTTPEDNKVVTKDEYVTVYDSNFDSFVKELKQQPHFVFDTETTSLSVFEGELVGIAISWSDEKAFYIPLAHKRVPDGVSQVAKAKFWEALGPIFSDSKIKKSGQNIKFDLEVLHQEGIEVNGIYFDTMIASYLLSPDRRSNSLSNLARDLLGRTMIEYKDVTKDLEDFSYVPIDIATQYSAEDAHIAWILISKLEPLIKEHELEKVFYEIEMPLVPVLARIEERGVHIDSQLLARISKEIEARLVVIKKELYEIAGEEFNINSTQQLSVIMFEKLGIPVKGVKKTKGGKISTNQAVLEMLAPQHRLPELVLQYRGLFKLQNTYVDVLPAMVSKKTGRLHSRFNQTITATGRLSSSDPNLQNIPIRTVEGARIRTAFIPEKGNILITADYSQIELRLLAHLSGDSNMIQTFKEDIDIHARTAREILGLPPLFEVSSDQRRIGKTINFGIVYGMGPFRLGKELGIPMGMAKDYIENYFNNFPKVREYFDKLGNDAREKGFVTTLFGRKRNISDIDTSGRDKDFVIRAAINAPIQGTAADIIKLAMIKIDHKIREMPVTMILQVHDELVFECAENFKDEAASLIRKEMEEVMELSVPLKVDLGMGYNWNETH